MHNLRIKTRLEFTPLEFEIHVLRNACPRNRFLLRWSLKNIVLSILKCFLVGFEIYILLKAVLLFYPFRVLVGRIPHLSYFFSLNFVSFSKIFEQVVYSSSITPSSSPAKSYIEK